MFPRGPWQIPHQTSDAGCPLGRAEVLAGLVGYGDRIHSEVKEGEKVEVLIPHLNSKVELQPVHTALGLRPGFCFCRETSKTMVDS